MAQGITVSPAVFALLQAQTALRHELAALPPFSVRAEACRAELEQLSCMIRARQK